MDPGCRFCDCRIGRLKLHPSETGNFAYRKKPGTPMKCTLQPRVYKSNASALPLLPLVLRLKPCRFLVAQAIRGEHQKISLSRAVEVDHPFPFRRNRAQVPIRGINAYDFTGRLKCADLGWIAFAGRSTAQTHEPAVRGPINVIGFVCVVLDAQPPRTDFRCITIELDRRKHDLMVS